jgi:hypothetical protein
MNQQEMRKHWLERAEQVKIESGAIPADPVQGIDFPKLIEMVLSAESGKRSELMFWISLISTIIAMTSVAVAVYAVSTNFN